MAEASRGVETPALRLEGGRLLVVEARFYEAIGALLFEGAKRAASAAGATLDVISVPGALEIPIALKMAWDAAARSGAPYAGAVALGCVVRGETYHFEVVCNESARALMDIAVAGEIPFGNAILTMDTLAQAEIRADPRRGDKGGDAIRAAIALANLKRRLTTR